MQFVRKWLGDYYSCVGVCINWQRQFWTPNTLYPFIEVHRRGTNFRKPPYTGVSSVHGCLPDLCFHFLDHLVCAGALQGTAKVHANLFQGHCIYIHVKPGPPGTYFCVAESMQAFAKQET